MAEEKPKKKKFLKLLIAFLILVLGIGGWAYYTETMKPHNEFLKIVEEYYGNINFKVEAYYTEDDKYVSSGYSLDSAVKEFDIWDSYVILSTEMSQEEINAAFAADLSGTYSPTSMFPVLRLSDGKIILDVDKIIINHHEYSIESFYVGGGSYGNLLVDGEIEVEDPHYSQYLKEKNKQSSSSSKSYGAGGYEMPNSSDKSFSDYVKRVDPELYDDMLDIYNEATGN